jgi:hypothetical protein
LILPGLDRRKRKIQPCLGMFVGVPSFGRHTGIVRVQNGPVLIGVPAIFLLLIPC